MIATCLHDEQGRPLPEGMMRTVTSEGISLVHCEPGSHHWTHTHTPGVQWCARCGTWCYCPECQGRVHGVGTWYITCDACYAQKEKQRRAREEQEERAAWRRYRAQASLIQPRGGRR